MGGGLSVLFTSEAPSSRASEALRLPKLLRLVLIYNTESLIRVHCDLEGKFYLKFYLVKVIFMYKITYRLKKIQPQGGAVS